MKPFGFVKCQIGSVIVSISSCASWTKRRILYDLVPPLETRELRECIGYLALAAKGLKGHNNSGRERLQADFTVVSAQRHKT
jgi:hypothetical protein